MTNLDTAQTVKSNGASARSEGEKTANANDMIIDALRRGDYKAISHYTEEALEKSEHGLNLSEENLSGLDLSSADLRGVNLTRARLDSTKLVGANLTNATIICALMERTAMQGAQLTNIYSHAISVVSSNWCGVQMQGSIDCTGSLFHGVQFAGANLQGGNYAGTTFYQCDLTDADLSNCDLSAATFNECVMRGTSLKYSNLTNAVISRSSADRLSMVGASGAGLTLQHLNSASAIDLHGARLPSMAIRAVALVGVKAVAANLPDITMTDVQLNDGDFSSTVLQDALFRRVSGQNNSFIGVQLSNANFLQSNLAGSDFRGASAENARFISCVMPDSKFTDFEGEFGRSSFTARGMTVRDCDFNRADFTGAYLYRASFTGDPVTGMQLECSSFRGANLIQAYVAANLKNADLRRAIGAYSRFNQSDLTDAMLKGATLYQSSFVKVKLANASLLGVKAPLFIDRCSGLSTATLDPDLLLWHEEIANTLSRRPSGST